MKDKYYVRNPESGESDQVTKEQWEKYNSMKNIFMPTIKETGIIQLFGTASENENQLEVMFNKNNKTEKNDRK